MRRSARFLLWLLATLLALLAVLALAAWLVLRASLPELDGTAPLAGLSAAVAVERDPAGVPVIRGANRLDVARATGFVHAQERFFQMDLTRRSAAGELAGLLGQALLATDRRIRVHRFRSRARAALADVDPADRALLEAYADGVNAGLARLRARPFEYLVLRAEPAPWQAEDSLLAVFAMWIDLQGTEARQEQQRDRLAAALPQPLVRLITGAGSPWDAALDGSVIEAEPWPSPQQYDLRTVDPALFDAAGAAAQNPLRLTAVEDGPGAFVGSNNWALAGHRTASGHALVANDMHLTLRVPNVWYRARLVAAAEGLDASGATLPGAPAIVAGSNGHVAWGFTNSYGDYQDLVIVEPVEGRPGHYLTADGPLPFERHEETLQVAGAEPEMLVVSETIWGPVIGEDAQGRPLVLAWTAHRPGAMNFQLASLERARNLDEAVAAASAAGMPAQNALLGDAGGRIAWVIAGRIPRRAGFDASLPAHWTEAGTGWQGWLGPEDQPRLIDPPLGAAWSANARVVGGEMLRVIGDGGYAHGARAHQIHAALAGLDEATPADFLAIQLDDRARYLEQWQRLLVAVLERGTGDADAALAAVRGWSGRAAPHDAGYLLVREFERTVTERAFDMLTVEARARWPAFRWRAPSRFTDVAWRLATERPVHLLDPRHPDWDAWLAAAAGAALESAREDCGTPALCPWGQVNRTRIRHALSPALPALARWLDMPATPMPGDWSTPRVHSPTFGASERFAVEPGREQHGYFHMPGGQSGHPLSPFYRAGHDAWVQGEPTPFLPGAPRHVLTLTPE